MCLFFSLFCCVLFYTYISRDDYVVINDVNIAQDLFYNWFAEYKLASILFIWYVAWNIVYVVSNPFYEAWDISDLSNVRMINSVKTVKPAGAAALVTCKYLPITMKMVTSSLSLRRIQMGHWSQVLLHQICFLLCNRCRCIRRKWSMLMVHQW